MRIYMLSTYREDGAEDVKFTTDINKVVDMFMTYDVNSFKILQNEISKLEEILSEGLCTGYGSGENLMSDWGGVQLHILDEWEPK